MKLTDLLEGAFVIKNKDGKTKRFKDQSSAEAKAWATSSSAKTAAAEKYSAAWWENKHQRDLASDKDVDAIYPWTKITSGEIANNMASISSVAGFANVDNWQITSQNTAPKQGLDVRLAGLLVTFYIGPEDDMGVDELTSDSQYITVRRDVKDPRTIMFNSFGRLGSSMKVNELLEGEIAKSSAPKGAKRVSLTQAFGSPELAALEEAGIKLTEKPDSWAAFEKGGYAESRNISKKTLKKIDNILGILPTYTGKEIFGTNSKPRGALADATFPAERMFIVAFDDGTQYLVDTTGASSYIRNWQKIV